MYPVRVADATRAPVSPVALDTAKDWFRVLHSEEDALIEALVAAAVEYAETATRRAVALALWELALPAFPRGACALEIPNPPVAEVVSVESRNAAGEWAAVAVDQYELEAAQEAPCLRLAVGASWPSGAFGSGPVVRVRYRAGYTESSIPPGIRTAVLLLASHWYTNREAVVNGTISTAVKMSVNLLLQQHRVDL